MYSAIKKYGVENFKIEIIEECSEENVSDREIFWIEYYQTYSKGYNAAKGGDGRQLFNHSLIVSTYLKVQNMRETARIVGCEVTLVGQVLRHNNIQTVPASIVSRKIGSKPVKMFDMNGNYLKTFSSISAAAESINSGAKKSSIGTNIGRVCNGKRKSANGYLWEYA